MRPVTWSQASVSVNDLSPAQSVMPVFPARATWISATRGAAARVSVRGPALASAERPTGEGACCSPLRGEPCRKA